LSLTQTDNDGDEINLPQAQTAQSENQQQLTQTSTKEENENVYTMEEISKHNSKESCWLVIRGKVYDLTNWIDEHSGGSDKILKLCGKDGTDLFVKQHGGKEKQ
jgi:cytochrome b involved in lipid metabolism